MNRFLTFVKDWLLPIAITVGVSTYLILHFVPALQKAGEVVETVCSHGQMYLVGVLLFLQYVKISPHDLKYQKWHTDLWLLQSLLFIGLAVPAILTDKPSLQILLECAMLCFICPTASAAGIITEKLGGNLRDTVSYLVMINVVATVLIPAVIPLVNPDSFDSFWGGVMAIAMKLFPILIMPCILAWIIRYTMHRLQVWLVRHAHWSFYIWGVSLSMAMFLATRGLVLSGISIWTMLGIAIVSMLCCAIQFAFGRRSAKKYGESEMITAGQTLGQKNTGFLIWLGYTFLTPVTSVAGGLYAIWQNLFNSWELYRKRKKEEEKG